MAELREKKKSAERKKTTLSMQAFRSSLTNGTSLFCTKLDERSAIARRYRDLICEHEADLGGADLVSASERRLIRRSAMLTLQLELLDAKFAASNDGGASYRDFECYQRATNTLRRVLESLGLQRRSRDITPTLQEYLQAKALQEEQRP
jgi:hypothetical protein